MANKVMLDIDDRLLKALDAYAKREGESRATVIRASIRKLLEDRGFWPPEESR